ncbi:MAG: hypothetical protein ACYS30_20610 [Planctomycetota bacterium]
MAKTCYIIGPIGQPDSDNRKWADFVKNQIIEPVVTKCGYQPPQRSDTDLSEALIMKGIIGQMFNADLVIADLTFWNANAFYELAIRHCVQKAVIHLLKRDESPPFDVKDHRVIPIDTDDKNLSAAQAAIEERIRAIETNPNQPYSLIPMSLQGKELDVLSPEDKLWLARCRVENRLKGRPGRSASFNAIRNEVNPRYTDDFLRELIRNYAQTFRRFRSKYGPGIKLQGEN